jgi:two-component system cell cycle sensor histidine kinase/response regulator CckA
MDKLKVLLVEDSVDDAELISLELKRSGLNTDMIRVENEAEFCDALDSGPWDLIISDFRLPTFSGMDAFSIFESHGVDIPFIMVSGTIGEEAAVEAMRRGVSDYLMKGNLKRLAPAIERELRDSAHRRDRRAAESALKESEERYRIVAETASDAIVTIDRESRMLYVNSAAEKIFGYTRAEMLGSQITMLMPEALKTRHTAAMGRYLETGKRGLDWSGVEIPARRKDGSEIIVHISFGEYRSSSHHLFTAIVRDITETKRAELALRQSELDFRALVEATTHFVWRLDHEGRNTELPHWWFELTGQAVEESFNFGWIEAIHPDDRENVKQAYLDGVRQKEPININLRILTAADGYRHYTGRGVPVFDDGGEFLQWICALIDTTEKTRAEIELRQSEENFRALIQATTQFVWTADENGSSEELFEWFSKMYQRPVSSVTEIIGLMHTEDAVAIDAEWTAALNNRTLFDRICRFVMNDGSTIYLAARSVPIFNDDGSFRHWIGTFTDITERMVGQVALRASETQLRTIVESVPECVKLLDTDGRLLKMNRAGVEMIEAESFDAIRGKHIAEIVSPEFRDAFIKCTKNVIAGNPCELQFEIVNLKGNRRWMDMKAVPIRDSEERVVSLLGVTRDETERRKADEAMRTSEERFRDLFENANDLIYTHDLHGNFTSLNRAGELITGYNRNEAAGLKLQDVVAPEYVELGLQMIREKIAGGAATTYETEILTKDGQRVMLDLSTRLIYENGKAVGVQGIARDITERRRAEMAIRSNELQLRVITNTIPVSITYIGADGILRFANRSFLEWLGKDSADVVGQNIRDLLGEQGYRQISPEFERVLRGELFDVERYAYTTPAGSEDGPPPYLRMNYVPEFAPSGEVLAFFAFMTDITESKNAELALRKSEEQLLQSQKLESVGRLAGGIAHDFNNMLTAINGYSELTLRRMHPGDPLRNNIEEIKKAGERSAELTNQLLAFSRRQIMQPRVLDLNRAVSDLIPMLERLIGEDVKLRTEFSKKSGMINADPGQLSQVLLNLIVNARDSMPDGGSILIATSEKQIDEETVIANDTIKPGRYSVLAISDTGTGMDEQTIQHIFEPFFTTKEVGKGTGLGLSTVHGIVHQSGGSIAVVSAPGKGTRFDIYLPTVESEPRLKFNDKPLSGMSFGTETILLVEDEETVRDLSREVLESCGYTVLAATDGNDALKILEEKGNRISLILTDVVMPNMGGRELAEETKKRFSKIKLLFASGYDNESIVNQDALLKGTNFIQKPFTFDALAQKIRELLDQK